MIVARVEGDALRAPQTGLLVPIAADIVRMPTSGFIRDAIDYYPVVRFAMNSRVEANMVFQLGETLLLEEDDRGRNKFIALVAMHRHVERGWVHAHGILKTSLEETYTKLGKISIATAGVPGTGYSGIKGAADPEKIEEMLETTIHPITIYSRFAQPDNEPRVKVEPLGSLGVILDRTTN